MKRSKRALALYVSSSLVLACMQGGCVSEASQPDTQPPVAAAPQASDETVQGVAQQSPARYRSSGVMTFIVNQDDVVYEKDLGPNTASVETAMTTYQADPTWTPADW